MQQTAHKVVVIGHRNPDTDSICSAIAYAELTNKTRDLVCEARRAGKMNPVSYTHLDVYKRQGLRGRLPERRPAAQQPAEHEPCKAGLELLPRQLQGLQPQHRVEGHP